ncbi:MAG: Inward rectifier potassium channel Irk [Sphingobacteriales bacterium]|nr:Inward rectifier potassium channel Irk [Sphingobacteriales bacterium]
MALLKRFRILRSVDNTGFGNNSSSGRFFDRATGGPNVGKRGVSRLNRYSWYHTMLGMKRGKFLFLLLFVYISINLVFAGIYYSIGVEHLAGIERSYNLKEFSEVFFFSTQTFTTVGYGRISPTGFLTSAVATFEAFLGLLSFAIATGLFYGRFSRPQAFLKFSDHALVSPYREGIALMFRIAPFKNNLLSEAEVKLTLAMRVEEDGKPVNKFYNLDTEISKVNSLSLSWTVVHPVNEKSPLYGFSEQDLEATDMELMVFVKAFDEVFSNTVVSRWSYVTAEIVWGARFSIMYHPSGDQTRTILDISLIDAYTPAALPGIPGTKES